MNNTKQRSYDVSRSPFQALEEILDQNIHLDHLIPRMSALLEKTSLKVLNLGCGRRPIPGAVNLDICQLPDLAVVADIRQGLPFKDGTFDAVITWSVLEHLVPDEFHLVLKDIVRVCKAGAFFKVHVPYFASEAAFSTIDHKSFFAYNTFWRYRESDTDPTTPKIFSDNMQVRLVWHTHKLLRIPNTLIMQVVNLHPLLAMFYQNFLCWLFPMRALDVVCTVVETDSNAHDR